MFKNRSFYLLVVMAVLVVTACAPQVEATPTATLPPASSPTVESAEKDQVWSEGLLPNGTWTVELSIEDFVALGVSSSDTMGFEGISTFTFQDGKAVYWHQGNSPYECEGSYEVVEDFVRITYTGQDVCNGVVEDVRWRLDDDGLHFQLIAAQNVPFDVDKAGWEAKPWQKVE